MEKTVLCFGSDGLEGDDIAFLVYKELEGKIGGVRFVKCDSPLDVLGYVDSGRLYILDAVKGLKKTSVFDSIEDFRRTKSVTAHDNDLGLTLGILSEMHKLRKVLIIGIPIGSNVTESVEEVKKILSSESQVQKMT